MKKFVLLTAAVAAMSFSVAAAEAGGWGHGGKRYNGHNNYSSGLINLSPSVKTGSINLLNSNKILSGNVISGILSGNKTILGNGLLGGNVLGILSGNNSHNKAVRKGKRHR